MVINNIDNRNKLILLGFVLVICLLILSAYSNTLYVPFVLDDLHSFVKEPKVLGFTFDRIGLESLATSEFGVRRFIPMLTFALDLKWGGGSPVAFHLSNIFIHILATLSLLFLLQSLFLFPKSKLSSQQTYKGLSSSAIIAASVVGLWALNPVQTNAVTYIVQRMTSIATLFYFLSFGCYLRGRFAHLTNGISKKVLFFYLSALISFICAMMSKEIAATLPVMVLLVEWLLIENSGLLAALKKNRKIVICVIFVIVALVLYKLYHGWLLGGYSHRHFTLSERLLTQLRIVVSYCGILLLPLPMWLNLEHDVALSTSLFSPPTTFFSLIFIVFVLSSAWCIRKKKPLISFAVFWFFINLSIESTIIPLELKFEHRLYLPSVGFYLALFLLIYECYRHFYGDTISSDGAKLFISVVLIICSGLSYLTYSRNIVWNSTVSLYQDCISKAPGKSRSHANLATAWLKSGKYDKALGEAEKGLALGIEGYEEYWVSASDIVASLVKLKKYDEAISRGELLSADAPAEAKKNSYPLFMFNLGRAYLGLNDFQSAFDWFFKGYKFCYQNDFKEATGFEQSMLKTLKDGLRQGYQFDPEMGLNTKKPDIVADEKMAQILFKLNNYDLALKYIGKVLAKDENSPVAIDMKEEIERISRLNSEQKKLGTLKEKYFYHPFSSRFNFFMMLSYALEKYNINFDALLQYSLSKAEALNKNSPDLYVVKSWYFYKLKEYDKALAIIDQGISLKPDYAQLWVNRGIYALAAGQTDAHDAFNKALTLYPGYPHRDKILAMQSLADKLVEHNDLPVER